MNGLVRLATYDVPPPSTSLVAQPIRQLHRTNCFGCAISQPDGFCEVVLLVHLKAQFYVILILKFAQQSETLFDHLQDTMRGGTFNNYSLCCSP